MDSGKVAYFVWTSTLTLLCVIAMISAKPTGMDQQWNSNNPQDLGPHYEIHPIDNCIFACDRCFKGESLVKCANACILSEAQMDTEWTTICPYLSRQYILGAVHNPFRH